ncbi:MAG: hypothetical protein ACJAXN_000372 [Psychromonas sp.]|jgi:hypothetical protein
MNISFVLLLFNDILYTKNAANQAKHTIFIGTKTCRRQKNNNNLSFLKSVIQNQLFCRKKAKPEGSASQAHWNSTFIRMGLNEHMTKGIQSLSCSSSFNAHLRLKKLDGVSNTLASLPKRFEDNLNNTAISEVS